MNENETRKAVVKQARQDPKKGQLAKEVFMIAQMVKHAAQHIERETNLLTKLESCNVNDRDTYGIDVTCRELRDLSDQMLAAINDSLEDHKPL